MKRLIDYANMRRVIVTGLKDYLQCPVIRSNQTGEPPAYPYCSYTITTLMSQNKGTYGEYADGTQAKPVKQTWSITVQSEDDAECVDLAVKARGWFDNIGTTYLNDYNVIVEAVGGVTNRDNFITTNYEYRKGFDVTFWLLDVVEDTTTETIESMETNINEQ